MIIIPFLEIFVGSVDCWEVCAQVGKEIWPGWWVGGSENLQGHKYEKTNKNTTKLSVEGNDGGGRITPGRDGSCNKI